MQETAGEATDDEDIDKLKLEFAEPIKLTPSPSEEEKLQHYLVSSESSASKGSQPDLLAQGKKFPIGVKL